MCNKLYTTGSQSVLFPSGFGDCLIHTVVLNKRDKTKSVLKFLVIYEGPATKLAVVLGFSLLVSGFSKYITELKLVSAKLINNQQNQLSEKQKYFCGAGNVE